MKRKLVFVFNKFYLDFLRDLKEVLPVDNAIITTIKAKYGVFDKQAADHIERVASTLKMDDDAQIAVLDGHTFGDVNEAVSQVSDGEYASDTFAYLLIMKIFAYMYISELDGGGDTINVVLQVIKQINDAPDAELKSDVILDETLFGFLSELKSTMASSKTKRVDVEVINVKDEPIGGDENMQSFFDNSIIGSLAKEISNEIDVSDLDIKDPSELLNFQSIGQPNSPLSKVVSSVGAKLQQKMAAGNLSQADLLSDAMKMMTMFNAPGAGGSGAGGAEGNPLMSALGSLMGGGTTAATSSLRSRKSMKHHKRRSSSSTSRP